VRCDVYEVHTLVAELEAEDGDEPQILSGRATVDALKEIHIQLGERVFQYAEGRAWLLGLALELRTPYLYPRYFENGRELSKEEIRTAIRRYVPPETDE
jgi:hypothetical protein